MRTFFILIFTFFIFSFSYGQIRYLKDENELREMADKTTRLFKEMKFHEMYSYMKNYWPIPEAEIDNLENQTKSISLVILPRYGSTVGYLKLKEQRLKDFAIKITYIVLFEKHAVRITYIFYNSGKGWILNSFKWDDNFKEEFE